MKKIFLVLFAFLGISLTNYASNSGTCTVIGGNGATVVVTVTNYYDDGNVDVSISSDCDDYVNVSFTIRYTTYSTTSHSNSAPRTSQTFTKLAQPNSDTPITVTLQDSFSKSTILSKIEHVEVTGAKCQK